MFGLLLNAASSLYGMDQSRDAAREVKGLAVRNTALVKSENLETERRLKRDIEQQEGLMSATSAASGVQVSGSRELAIADTKKENKLQMDWLKKTGLQKELVTKAGGNIQAGQLQAQAMQQGVSALTSIYEASNKKGLFS